MLQKKLRKFLLGQYLKKEDSNRLQLYAILFAYSWKVRKSLFRFSSSNGMHVTCVCLRCSKRKQDCHRFFYQTAFISICASIYRVNADVLIHGELLSQIATL